MLETGKGETWEEEEPIQKRGLELVSKSKLRFR